MMLLMGVDWEKDLHYENNTVTLPLAFVLDAYLYFQDCSLMRF